ncbi:formylglycine-generating enzyme family protein [Vibrio hepatarius]|uniref:formylglycine-generating enzyme family protein n=1 Tax=Vibrio hepatarius TaxID=171383 RepID=UPI00142E2118|nr:SUMF1/EgtB/PvdO family nonheme iron enzyme [Vibrio hepatarius]NIY85490.1 formylglycine-generating enzyme family protein [Vibrio hepatarius]
MNNKWLSMVCLMPIIAGCGGDRIDVSSEHLSTQQLETIISNINAQYPDVGITLKKEMADVAVKAIENLVFVEGGSFDMGDFKGPCEIPSKTRERMDWSPNHKCYSIADFSGQGYQHKVTLDAYSIAKFETTYADMEVMRKVSGLPLADQNLDGTPMDRDSTEFKRDLKRWEQMAASTRTWQNAKDYCQWLGNITALPFDLPTEAQWEYAARSRGQNRYFATNTGYRQVKDGSYYNPKTGYREYYRDEDVNASSRIAEVDAFPPNPLGVYGMSNQVAEWVNDWYAKDYYQHSPEHNPQGPESGTEKVQRDGSGVTMTFSRLHASDYDRYRVGVSFRCAVQQSVPVNP